MDTHTFVVICRDASSENNTRGYITRDDSLYNKRPWRVSRCCRFYSSAKLFQAQLTRERTLILAKCVFSLADLIGLNWRKALLLLLLKSRRKDHVIQQQQQQLILIRKSGIQKSRGSLALKGGSMSLSLSLHTLTIHKRTRITRERHANWEREKSLLCSSSSTSIWSSLRVNTLNVPRLLLQLLIWRIC